MLIYKSSSEQLWDYHSWHSVVLKYNYVCFWVEQMLRNTMWRSWYSCYIATCLYLDTLNIAHMCRHTQSCEAAFLRLILERGEETRDLSVSDVSHIKLVLSFLSTFYRRKNWGGGGGGGVY